MEPVAAKPGAPDGVRAYMLTHVGGKPMWARRLDQAFEGMDRFRSASNRFIIFLPVGQRVFAVCFGYASGALDWNAVETGFGLSLAARTMSDAAIRELKSRRFDVKARTQSVQVPGGGSLRDLDVELEGEFVFRLAGKMADMELDTSGEELDLGIDTKGALIAGDSIAFRAEVDLKSVQAVLDEFLGIVIHSPPSDAFAFVDALKPIKSSDSRMDLLEKKLIEILFGGEGGDPVGSSATTTGGGLSLASDAMISLAPPDELSVADIGILRILKGKGVAERESISLESVVAACKEFRGDRAVRDLRAIRIEALSMDDTPLGPTLPLLHWLVAELPVDGRRYVLTMGKWFAIDAEFVAKLDSDLASIPDLTNELRIPDWDPEPGGRHLETPWNARAFKGVDWVTLDTVDLRSGGDEIEACDQMHRDGHLVHIKRYDRSHTMSHLFAQGTTSAEVLIDDDEYKRAFVQAVRERNPEFVDAAQRAPESVVYAIAVSDGRAIPGSLPTFSKVNLRNHCRRLRRAKLRPAVARVNIVH